MAGRTYTVAQQLVGALPARLTGAAPAGIEFSTELLHITLGQRRVVEALLSSQHAMTYGRVAARLGIGLGTVYTHLRRLRERSPELYAEVMTLRRQQLEARHTLAVWRAQYHSDQWHRAQSARRHYRLFGCWPHERKFYKQLGRLDLLEALRRSRGYR
jgi:transposase